MMNWLKQLISDFIIFIQNLLTFNDINYLLSDILFVTNTVCLISFVAFLFSYRQPFLLILFLEIIYLGLNINFSVAWLLAGFEFGLVYILIILGLSAAETVIGLVFVIFLAKSHWIKVGNTSKLN